MGCIETNQKPSKSMGDSLVDRLKEVIECENELKLQKTFELLQRLQSSSEFIYDLPRIPVKSNLLLTPLSYSIVKGKDKSFTILLKLGCSFTKMYENFLYYQVKPLDFILAKGYINVFTPFFTEYQKIRMSPIVVNDPMPSSAVQVATRKGMLDILQKIYYTYLEHKFSEFDLTACDENGENCALIACREGILPLMKFFHETCKLDFDLKNGFGENAIIICLDGFRVKRNYGFKACVEYLVENVKVDYTYEWVKMMKLASGEIFEYLKEKLQNIGIDLNMDVEEHVKDRASTMTCGGNFDLLCEEGSQSTFGFYPRHSW